MELNWTDKQYEEYDGHDLILGTGVPGSKWSGIFKAVNGTSIINDTAQAKTCYYSKVFYNNVAKESKEFGFHFGAYWGPQHEYGQEFDNLHMMSKKDIIKEFAKPFKDWDKLKLIKSHWFLYDLDYLIKIFPKAKVIACYLPDDICFDWWHKVGGWNITYPHYDWFVDDTRMKQEIKIGNALLIKFFAERNIPLKSYANYLEVFNDLNIDVTINDLPTSKGIPYNGVKPSGDTLRVPGCSIGVYNGKIVDNHYLKELLINDPLVLDIFTILEDENL
jgi:hypothetical protein